MAKLWRKLKWLVFFLGHGVYKIYTYTNTLIGGRKCKSQKKSQQNSL